MNEARRAQVLAVAADVFARTAITPEALSEIARMSKGEIIEELIAHNMEQTFTALQQVEAAPGPLLESLIDAVPAGVARNLAPEPGAVELELMAEAVRNPKVAEALRAADRRRHDLVNESVDVALRWGVLEDSSAMALGEGLKWRSFKRDGRATSVPFGGRLTISSRQGAIAAAVAGLGIVSTGFLFCRPEIASGALVQVLADWQIEPIELHAVFAAGRAAKPSARAFADYLASALR
jgi:DNA-binding transcriptional LysR family regulator